MDARQRRSKSVLTTLHERAGSLPLSARPEVFDQRYGSANYNVKSNQIKSLLLSHHHSTCALLSEILESVLHTVQKQLTYRQYHYLLTDLYRQCAIYTYIYSIHTVYC